MDLELLQVKPIIRTKDLFPDFINDLIFSFENILSTNLEKGIKLDFDLKIRSQFDKKTPILQIAKPEEAKEIVEIFNSAYKGTYPYIEMVDEQEILKMIQDPDFHWIVFKIDYQIIVGCYGFHVDYENKSGTFHGFAIKREYQNHVDVLKIILGCIYAIVNTYKDKILVWSCEIRTAHSISQYMGLISGLYPVAFLPNKDIFFDRIESSLLFIMYDDIVFQKFQSKRIPNVLLDAASCYLHSKLKYKLGKVRFKNPDIDIDLIKVNEIRKHVEIKVTPHNLSYEKISLFIENSDSYFEFCFAPYILNCEKTQYKVNSLEELYVFIQEVKSLIRKLHIRYFECFISTREPVHQKLFCNAGFKPRGYIPSWKYIKAEKVFEDYIVFNYYTGNTENIQLIPESLRLLESLNISVGLDSKVI